MCVSSTTMNRILPKRSVPALSGAMLPEGTWNLADQQPEHFSFLFFYRGLHCPICGQQLRSLEKAYDDFIALGIQPIALSMDSEERAAQSRKDWHLNKLPQVYGLSEEVARTWNLYISHGFKEGEPDTFSEPALHIVRPNGELYASSIQTMPFTRPAIPELLGGFRYIIDHDYPSRGDA